jgi:hypothetical protein
MIEIEIRTPSPSIRADWHPAGSGLRRATPGFVRIVLVISERINRPAPPSSAEALAEAWATAAANLPPDWAIYYLHGESTYGDEAPFWIASAGGPDLGGDYAEGFGRTPDDALHELARNLARKNA